MDTRGSRACPNRLYERFPVIFSRPAQNGYDRALEGQDGELYYLPTHNGEQREVWVWTNWRGQVVERAEWRI
jgi:hypothetical protein